MTPTATVRAEVLWIGILALAQLADVFTTSVDLAHGDIERNPQAASLIALGGVALFWFFKFALVGAMGIALILTRRGLVRNGGPVVRLAHLVAIRGTQVTVIVLTLICINNAMVLGGTVLQ